MARMRVAPTRMELSKLKERLAVATRGHKLLKDKRDEMVRQFVLLARENKTLRERVERDLSNALYEFMLARAVMNKENLEQALLAPAREVKLTLDKQNIMSVIVPKISIETTETTDIGYSYGYAFTSSELDGAISTLADLLPSLVALAEKEKACSMLADEIEKTRRRVNALEFVLIPQMETDIRYISMKLDENERANITRLMKVKEIIQEREGSI